MKNKILIIAAHADDEVLGCGGSIAKQVRLGNEVHLLVLTDGESSRQNPQVKKRLESLNSSCEILGIKTFKALCFKDSLLDSYPILEIVKEIEFVAKTIQPQIVYTHSPSDINQDHRVAYLATMTAFRPLPDSSVKKILSYEVPSSTEYGQCGNLPHFSPNYFENLETEDLKIKDLALDCYRDEVRDFPHPRSKKGIEALGIVRGVSVGLAYAEAFCLERFISKQ